jgi:hypothetical protein
MRKKVNMDTQFEKPFEANVDKSADSEQEMDVKPVYEGITTGSHKSLKIK